MKNYDFYSELLKRFEKSSIKKDECRVFSVIIELIGSEKINSSLNYWFNECPNNYNEMFYRFHKSIRQTDFSNRELIEPINMKPSDWGVKEDMEVNEVKEIKRKKIREIAQDTEEVVLQEVGYFNMHKKIEHSDGLIDSLFWNMIHVSNVFDVYLKFVFDDIDEGRIKPILIEKK